MRSSGQVRARRGRGPGRGRRSIARISGSQRVAGHRGPRQVGALERHRRRLGEATHEPVGGTGAHVLLERPRSAPARARRPARTRRWRDRRARRRRPAGDGGRSRSPWNRPRTRPHAAPRLASVSRRWMPRPGSSSSVKPAAGTRSASTPRSLPTKWISPRSRPAVDERLGDRQAGQQVAGGAAAGDDRPGPVATSAGRGDAPPGGASARSRRRGAGSTGWRAMLSRRPVAARLTSSAEPPNDTNGSGTPVIGMRPITAPMFTAACTSNHAVMPMATSSEKRSRARAATTSPSRPRAPNRTTTMNAPSRPNSSPMMAKMKSVWAYGRKPHLARDAPRPLAEQAAVGEADHRLHGLVAGVAGILHRVEEREEPATSERRAGHRRRWRGRRRRGRSSVERARRACRRPTASPSPSWR